MRDSQRGTGSRRSNLTVVKIILIDGSLQTRLESSGNGEGRSRGRSLGLNLHETGHRGDSDLCPFYVEYALT